MDCSSPGPSVHGISQQEYLSGLTFSAFPGDLANPGIKSMSPTLAGRFLLVKHEENPQLKVVQGKVYVFFFFFLQYFLKAEKHGLEYWLFLFSRSHIE